MLLAFLVWTGSLILATILLYKIVLYILYGTPEKSEKISENSEKLLESPSHSPEGKTPENI